MNAQIEKIMKALKCSEQEAKEIIEADKAIDKGEKMDFDLSPEAEKQAKKYTKTGTRQTNSTKTERKRKENVAKSAIIAELNDFLIQKGYYKMVQILNKERQISFKIDGNDYELTLIQKRKPK